MCVGECTAGVVPSHFVGPVLKGWVAPPFVCVGPAGVEVAHEKRLVPRVALVFMHFSHDEILDVG